MTFLGLDGVATEYEPARHEFCAEHYGPVPFPVTTALMDPPKSLLELLTRRPCSGSSLRRCHHCVWRRPRSSLSLRAAVPMDLGGYGPRLLQSLAYAGRPRRAVPLGRAGVSWKSLLALLTRRPRSGSILRRCHHYVWQRPRSSLSLVAAVPMDLGGFGPRLPQSCRSSYGHRLRMCLRPTSASRPYRRLPGPLGPVRPSRT